MHNLDSFPRTLALTFKILPFLAFPFDLVTCLCLDFVGCVSLEDLQVWLYDFC